MRHARDHAVLMAGPAEPEREPAIGRVAWVEREWLWWVVRSRHCPGGRVMTVDTRFLRRSAAETVATVMNAIFVDGVSAGRTED